MAGYGFSEAIELSRRAHAPTQREPVMARLSDPAARSTNAALLIAVGTFDATTTP